jgi:mono/diheme cytochrome c family protein
MIMQRMNLKTFVVIALLLLVHFACSSRKSEPLTGKNFNSSNAHVVNGEKLYMLHCQKCHPAGEAGLGPALNSNPAPQFVKRFQMRHGLGVMPGFTEKEISKDDLRDISKYLKALKAQ